MKLENNKSDLLIRSLQNVCDNFKDLDETIL